jgi:hypothetical protein
MNWTAVDSTGQNLTFEDYEMSWTGSLGSNRTENTSLIKILDTTDASNRLIVYELPFLY